MATRIRQRPNEADTTPQMVVALLHQLVDIYGIPQQNIYIGDPVRYFLDKMYVPCHASYPNVHYIDCLGQAGRELATYSNGPLLHYSTHPPEIINGIPAPGIEMSDQIADFIVNANYLINLAVLRRESGVGCCLCAKNNLNAMNRSRGAPGQPALWQGRLGHGVGSYNALVDHMGNQYLGGKTLLYMIDGLFGGWWANGQDSMPEKWNTAPMTNWWPSSVFASQDPVAIDAVGLDFLLTETNQIADCADNYQLEAALANNPPSTTFYDPNRTGAGIASLGVHEHWNDPIDKQYTRNIGTGAGIELVSQMPSTIEVSSVSTPNGVAVSVPITLVAQGTENALGFSLQFDPNLFASEYESQ